MTATVMRSSPSRDNSHGETKSHTSYKSTHSSRSSVLERAREYTRRMEGDAVRRAKSLDRKSGGESDRRSSTGEDSE